MTPRVLVLSFPEFVVDVERAWLRVSPSTPVIVGGRADGPGVVVAACRLARAAGVAVRMPLVEAAQRCPEAVFAPGVLDRFAEAASVLDEEVRRECPAVAWRAIDEAVVTSADGGVGPGALADIADRLRLRLQDRLAFSVAAGVADSEVTARAAAAMVAPSGLLQVLPGYDARFLASLPLDTLRGLPAPAAVQLRAEGIDTLGALAALDDEGVTRLLGAAGRPWRLAASGVDPHPATPTSVPRSLTRARETPDVTTLDALRTTVEAVAHEVAARVSELGLQARTVTVRVVGPDDRFSSRSTALSVGVSSRESLPAAARALAPQLWRYGRPPQRVSVVATGLTAEGPQLTLFGGQMAPAAPAPGRRLWVARPVVRTPVRHPSRAS